MARQTPFEWIREKLNGYASVGSTEIISSDVLRITRKEGEPLTVTTSDHVSFDVAKIRTILGKNDVDFILHTTKEPLITGDVFDYLEGEQKVLGGFGDVLSIVNQETNWPFYSKDVQFIMRGLRQHTKVSEVRRLDNKRYEITRHGLEPVTIIALYDYDLGIESIRDAIDKYRTFDAVLKANPNGQISTSGYELTESKKIRVLWWRELLGALNNKWTWNR